MKRIAFGLLSLSLTVAAAEAQVTQIAFDSFDYPTPALLHNQSGGSGWAGAWEVEPLANPPVWCTAGLNGGVLVFSQNIVPPFLGADAIGNYAGQSCEFFPAWRFPDQTGHDDVTENGQFGKDGAILWFSFLSVQYQPGNGTESFGGVSVFAPPYMGADEKLFVGSPWGTNEWGLHPDSPNPNSPFQTIAGSSVVQDAKIVVRVDHMPGDERVRMWLDPTEDYPTSNPDIDVMAPDFRWDRVRLNSGGAQGAHYFWDAVTVAKGEPIAGGLGTNYCGPAANNSTGGPGMISASGSDSAGSNNVILFASNLPQNQFGYFLNSMNQGFVAPGGSQGFLCLSNPIGRYNANIFNSGSAGAGSLPLDLTNTPTPTGPVSVMAGQSWNFQCWYRDVNPTATSNFTDGLTIMFQ